MFLEIYLQTWIPEAFSGYLSQLNVVLLNQTKKYLIISDKKYLIHRIFLYGFVGFPLSAECKVFQIMNLSSSEIVNYTSSDYNDNGGNAYR